jgi:hypothetical protein
MLVTISWVIVMFGEVERVTSGTVLHDVHGPPGAHPSYTDLDRACRTPYHHVPPKSWVRTGSPLSGGHEPRRASQSA